MLKLEFPEGEVYNEEANEFIIIPATTLLLEHSLLSVSAWESKWKRSFLDSPPNTNEEIQSYIICMDTEEHEPDFLNLLLSSMTKEHVVKIKDYLEDPHSATVINDRRQQKPGRKEVITSELIYYWLSAAQIPFEVEKWNFNRLMKLLQIVSIKNEDPKKNKMSKGSIMRQNSALNAARRAKHGSKG